jgi:hypothetical protein
MTKVKITIDKHVGEIPIFVTKLEPYPVVLGISRLKKHDVSLHFRSKTVHFDSDYCLQHRSPVPPFAKEISSQYLKANLRPRTE